MLFQFHFDLMLLDFIMSPIHGDKVVEEITNYHKLDLYTNKDLHDIADKTPREDEINDYLYTKNYENDGRDFDI